MAGPRTTLRLVAAVLALAGGLAPLASATPGAATTAAVSLGDSFISGEGGRWLGNALDPFGARDGTDRAAYACGWWGCSYDRKRVYGTSARNGCDRSDMAPIQSRAIAVERAVNLACSGARARDVWRATSGGTTHRGEPPQADRLARIARRLDVRLIVLTVGANDAGFGKLVARCAAAWTAGRGHCRHTAHASLASALPAARAAVARSLREVRAVMRGAGYSRDDYSLVLAGYASPLPPGDALRYPERGWARLRTGGCPFWDEDADWARRRAVPYMNRQLRRAAGAAGATFLDLRGILRGHEVCHRRARLVDDEHPASGRASEWVRWLVSGALQGSHRESLHPNAYGQRAIGRCFALIHAAPAGDWACRRHGRGIGSAYLSALP